MHLTQTVGLDNNSVFGIADSDLSIDQIVQRNWRENIVDRLLFVRKKFIKKALVSLDNSLLIRAKACVDFADFDAYTYDQILNIQENSYDLIITTPCLQYVGELPALLDACKKRLTGKGLFIGSCIGEDSFFDIKVLFAQHDHEIYSGLAQRFIPLIHTKDAGALMQSLGFYMPISDCDRILIQKPLTRIFSFLKKYTVYARHYPLFQHSKRAFSVSVYKQWIKESVFSTRCDIIYMCGFNH
jgi:SAM-dependent methyltransferase